MSCTVVVVVDDKNEHEFSKKKSVLVSISGRANTHPLFWTSSLAVQFSLSPVSIFLLARCLCFIYCRVFGAVRAIAQPSTEYEWLLFFSLLHFTFLFCSRQRSTVQKGQVLCACVQQYNTKLRFFDVSVFFAHRHPFLLPNTMHMWNY